MPQVLMPSNPAQRAKHGFGPFEQRIGGLFLRSAQCELRRWSVNWWISPDQLFDPDLRPFTVANFACRSGV
jgi:hypothetical protein